MNVRREIIEFVESDDALDAALIPRNNTLNSIRSITIMRKREEKWTYKKEKKGIRGLSGGGAGGLGNSRNVGNLWTLDH